MISRRNLLWFIPLCLFISFPLWRPIVATFLTPRGGYDESLAQRQVDVHNFSMDQVHITQSEFGKITLKIIATRAYTGKTEDEFEMEEVDATVTATDGEQTFITSRKGILEKKAGILTLIEEVVVMNPKDKTELYTELLIYDDNTKIAHSPGKTQIISKKIEVRGNNLLFNTETKAYDLSGRVLCTLANFSSPNDTTPRK